MYKYFRQKRFGGNMSNWHIMDAETTNRDQFEICVSKPHAQDSQDCLKIHAVD